MAIVRPDGHRALSVVSNATGALSASSLTANARPCDVAPYFVATGLPGAWSRRVSDTADTITRMAASTEIRIHVTLP
jgi:hypothetical protein